MEFELKFELEGHEHIELQSLLKVSGLCETGGAAKVAITCSQVKVDGQVETRRSKKIVAGQIVFFKGQQIKVVA